ncbi:hypothetical protein CSOJ01_13668 [Colletotrichum sojae]|uniref:Uncharacterized protein n=1 Tax=Colletotrichum sojae TaxID=2175907 RepID=A0A8H6ISJ5_9PEZI|nr:hypothetical protein CSOJ01_13668 [Colletotrichum sojae]
MCVWLVLGMSSGSETTRQQGAYQLEEVKDEEDEEDEDLCGSRESMGCGKLRDSHELTLTGTRTWVALDHGIAWHHHPKKQGTFFGESVRARVLGNGLGMDDRRTGVELRSTLDALIRMEPKCGVDDKSTAQDSTSGEVCRLELGVLDMEKQVTVKGWDSHRSIVRQVDKIRPSPFLDQTSTGFRTARGGDPQATETDGAGGWEKGNRLDTVPHFTPKWRLESRFFPQTNLQVETKDRLPHQLIGRPPVAITRWAAPAGADWFHLPPIEEGDFGKGRRRIQAKIRT